MNKTGAAKGIMQLPHRWERVLHNFGVYIEGLWEYELCRYAVSKVTAALPKLKLQPSYLLVDVACVSRRFEFLPRTCLICPRKWTCRKLFMVLCFLRHRISVFSPHWKDRAVGKCWGLLWSSVFMNVTQLITTSPLRHRPTGGCVCEYHLLQA